MPPSTTTGHARTGRYYVRIPQENVTEINGYIKESGMRQAHFLSNALVVGARRIAPQSRKSPIQEATPGEQT
ncbi:MAG TPA: hypothetical protein VGE45_10810 [Chloroflexia bacterium]|jgi:hypothetical protein